MDPFSVEHIIPYALSGETELDNLALACQGCNGSKHIKVEGYDNVLGRAVPLYHPRRDKWEDHFSWNQDCSEVLGLTATGRTTIAVLHLNRPGLVNLRRVLFAMGVHPPE